jgi:periplasmic protein TonB
VDLAGQTQRVMAAALIVAVHAIGLYALTRVGPHLKQITAGAPVMARLISSSEHEPKPKPPAIKPVHAVVTAQMPEMPFIEIPISAPSASAITIPVRNAPPPAASADDGAPKLISTVEYLREPSPRYPPQSRRLREQGLVVLKVLIDERGTACEIEIESSSGYARLDDAAREAVRRAAFRPYVEDGAPRRALVLIPIEFSLNRTAA